MGNKVVYKNTSGIGFTGALLLLFIGLKLTGNIAWSWWWVMSPLWIPLSLVVALLLIGALLTGAAWGLERRAERKAAAQREADRKRAAS